MISVLALFVTLCAAGVIEQSKYVLAFDLKSATVRVSRGAGWLASTKTYGIGQFRHIRVTASETVATRGAGRHQEEVGRYLEYQFQLVGKPRTVSVPVSTTKPIFRCRLTTVIPLACALREFFDGRLELKWELPEQAVSEIRQYDGDAFGRDAVTIRAPVRDRHYV